MLVAGQPNGAASWFPCDDHPSAKASYRIQISTDSPYRALANGELVSRRVRAGHTVWTYEQPEPTSTYLITLQIGMYETHTLAKAPVPMRAVLPDRLRSDFDHDFGFGPGVFPERWVDPAATNGQQIARAQEIGGLVIVNHENPPTVWMTYDWSSLDMDGLEVWNGGNRHDQSDDDAYHGKLDVNSITEGNALTAELPEDPIERSYIGLLKTGRWPLAAVGGSDAHDYNEIVCGDFPCDPTNAELASPTTSVWADRFVWTDGARGVGDGLAAGRVVIHDRSNFIDLRVGHEGREHIVGDTIGGYVAGEPLDLRAFGRVAEFVDGDNRVLLILGTSGDAGDRTVDVLYSSEDEDHFVEAIAGELHMRTIRPDSSFDRRWTVALSAQQLGAAGTYFVWAQFVPWHNPLYLYGNGQDMAITGVVRIRADG